MKLRKCIFITGAASGIGRETALFFANKGWYTGLYDVNTKGLETLSKEIGTDNCCYKRMDVSDIVSVKKGIDHFSKHTNYRMDVLFNNAGIIRMGPLENISISETYNIVNVNLIGILNCIYEGLDLLKKTKGARIINMSSASSLYGTPHLAVYSATKAAISSLTESLNLELEKYGIFVNDVRALYVETPLLDQKVKAPSIKKLGVRLMPRDIAKVVYMATTSGKIHNDTKGIKPLLFLLMIPTTEFLRNKILKMLMLEK